jgi:hypothetical protein
MTSSSLLRRTSTRTRTRTNTRTTIMVAPETRHRLIKIGKKGETYDLLINKLLDHYHNFTIKGGGNKKR